ncbi:MAG: HNH endonuclease [Lachnospiraceae bacterium]|nr:HNH endonuclease [Lachnospiraceae bacterium]
MFRKYDISDEKLSYARLVEEGLKAKPMSPLAVRGNLAEYLHACDWLQHQLEENNITPNECIDIKELSDLVVEQLDEPQSTDVFEKRVSVASSLSTEKLRRIIEQRKAKGPREVERRVVVRERCEAVSVLAKRRANGICQLCGAAAPFVNHEGVPYLETHHIEWLSKGGEDSEENTVALCPNCHKKMHILNDPDDVVFLKGLVQKQ